MKDEASLTEIENMAAGDVRGHQVRRKLNTIGLEPQNPAHCFDQQRLAQTGQ